MDYRIYHAINVFVSHHAWLGRSLAVVEQCAVSVYAVATVAFERLTDSLLAKLVWRRQAEPRPS